MRPSILHILIVAGCLSYAVRADAADIPYRVVSPRWPEELGNHRARIHVADTADAVRVRIPWRRDASPEQKNVVITDAAGQPIKNRVAIEIHREYGDLAFQPHASPGDYYVYYMPYTDNKIPWSYSTQYTPPQATADAAWLQRHDLTADRLLAGKWKALPKANVAEFQTWNEFQRFDPMEVIATAEETKQLLAQHASHSYLLFPEDRKTPIRMTDDLPLCWIERGPSDRFSGEACRGEFYTFQMGVFAATASVEDLAVEIGDLRPRRQGAAIPAGEFRSFNLAGTDWLGRPMKKSVTTPQGKVQALWFGIQIPKDAAPGMYDATLTVRPKNAEPSIVKLQLAVLPQVLEDGGVGDLWRHARLKWLDSTMGLDDEVVAPYTPLKMDGRTVQCLGRTVAFGDTGLPEFIRAGERNILAKPMTFVVETADGVVPWTGGRQRLVPVGPGTVHCESTSVGGPFQMDCNAKMEFDGYINVRIDLTANRDIQWNDARLEIPFRADVAAYMMGLERKGGYRPKEWKWKWDIRRNTSAVWIGDVDAGLQCKLKGPRDTWESYDLRVGGIPESWGNNGKGGCTVAEQGNVVVFRAFSGPRAMKAGEELEFRFGLLVTPVKPLDPAHWNQRYFHNHDSSKIVPIDTIAATGANIVNCHHGNDLNLHINYPFLAAEQLASYARQAHEKGMKFKIYYTVRELSSYATELWALQSLGDEILADGPGGGCSWLQEHLVHNYQAAWHQPLADGDVDGAIGTTGLSRWHNYYLEGLAWLIKNAGIDGLYLDGIGYDREIMKRVRKVMNRARPGCLIDFHCGNEFPPGDARISCANKFMEHFPYINSLWFGEGYDYNETPDYWLVEISGIPFGLFGEMLGPGGGNPWRGMVYGMTGRMGYMGDPAPVWKVWDAFGIQNAQMIGYWDKACPVKTGRKDVLATAYVKKGQTLVAVASWAPENVKCKLAIDWNALGLNVTKAKISAPDIRDFQSPAEFSPTDEVPISPGRGLLLRIHE